MVVMPETLWSLPIRRPSFSSTWTPPPAVVTWATSFSTSLLIGLSGSPTPAPATATSVPPIERMCTRFIGVVPSADIPLPIPLGEVTIRPNPLGLIVTRGGWP